MMKNMVKEKPYCYGDVDQSHQMAVSDLKKILAELPDEALIFMEPANSANRGNNIWSDKVIVIFECNGMIRKSVEDKR